MGNYDLPRYSLNQFIPSPGKTLNNVIDALRNNKIKWDLNPTTGLPKDYDSSDGFTQLKGTFLSGNRKQSVEIQTWSRRAVQNSNQSGQPIPWPAMSKNPDDPDFATINVNGQEIVQMNTASLDPGLGSKIIHISDDPEFWIADSDHRAQLSQLNATTLSSNLTWLQTYDNNPTLDRATKRQHH